LGIDPETNYIIEERPFYTTPDGSGKAVMDLLQINEKRKIKT
jgi:hypothetical protein